MKDSEVYKLIFENTINAMFLTDPSGKIYEANSAAEEMLGMNKEEIYSLGRDGIVDTSDPNFKLFCRDRENNGKAFGELKFIRKDGTKLPVEASSNLFKLDNGETRVCVVARDLIENKINQILMKEASEFNRKIIKSAPIGIATYNSMGQCVSANDYCAEITGATKEQLLSQNFSELASWRKYGLYTLAKLALDEGIEIHKEIFMVTTFGKSIWLNLTFTHFTSGSEPHLLMMIEDISDRKKAEELLKKSEEKFRTSVENMLDPFAIFEAVRNSDNKIVDFSTRYINPAGISLAEKIAVNTPLRHLLEIFTLQDFSGMFNELCEIVESGNSLNREAVMYNTNGKKEIKCALDLNIVQLGDGLAISCRDITETKTVLEKLKEINNNKDKFFSIIAHDLKAPFHSFLGISETLADNHGNLSPEETKKFFQASSTTVKNTFKLLEDLLQWANTQSGHVAFNPVSFSITDLLTQTVSLYDNAAKEKDVNLVFNPILDFDVIGDKNMIETVSRNLISNAVKFTDKGGVVEIKLTTSDNYCTVAVSDTGEGISEININKIFKLGEKVSTVGTNNEKGTGLGLILCKDFIEKNNGVLSVESTPGEGSKFSFTIPLSPAADL